MGIFDIARRPKGRRRLIPQRDTVKWPNLVQIGRMNEITGLVYKATPRNLRYFSRHPYARRAINAIKDPIKMIDWEIAPIDGVDWNPELQRQAEIATNCFTHPNESDDFPAMIEQVLEDYLCGAGALETQVGSDNQRPLWMWPTDGLSIQIYPNWQGDPKQPHYAQTLGYGSEFGGGQIKQLFDDELLYMRPNRNTATPFGFGPLEIAFTSIARLLAVGNFAGRVSGNQHSSILIDFPNRPPADLEAIRNWWKNDIEGMGQVPITSTQSNADSKLDRVQVHKLYPDGDSALYLDYQAMLVRELGCAFNLSPQNFGLERDVNRNTSEVAEDRDWDQAIKPTAQDFAKAFTRHCIHGRLGFPQLRFRFIGLDREDELSTMQILDRRYKTNSITANEIRERFGEAPMDNSPWADLTWTDIQIAMSAARGAKEVIDPELPGQGVAQTAQQQPPQSKTKRRLKARKPKGK